MVSEGDDILSHLTLAIETEKNLNKVSTFGNIHPLLSHGSSHITNPSCIDFVFIETILEMRNLKER